MELVRCYCGTAINPNTGPDHLLDCKKWQKKSQIFQLANSLVEEAGGPTLLRIECEALMMYEFPSNSPVEIKQKPIKKWNAEDLDSETLKLIEKLKREENPRDDGLVCILCQCTKSDMSEMSFLNCGHLICNDHIRDEIMSSYANTGNAKCPTKCGYILSLDEILTIVSQETLDNLQQPQYDTDTDGFLASCPCGTML